MRKGDKIKISSSGSGSGNSVDQECDGYYCDNFNYLEVLSLTIEPNQNPIASGTMLARYGTKKSCGSLCEWEITKFSRGNGFVNSNGKIIIQTPGVFSITAQLHNKHGNSGKWLRNTIYIWDDSYDCSSRWNPSCHGIWKIMAQRFTLLLKIMKTNCFK